MLLELSCSYLRFHTSLYTPSLSFLLPILLRGPLGELLPLSSCFLLSIQVPQGLHQVGGSSWVTCKTQNGIQPSAGEEQVPAVVCVLQGVAKEGQKPDKGRAEERWCKVEETAASQALIKAGSGNQGRRHWP